MISLLVTLLVLCVVIWAARTLLGAFSIGEPLSTVIYVVIVLIVVMWLVGGLGGFSSVGPTGRVLHW